MTEYHTRQPKKNPNKGKPILEWRISPVNRHFEVREIANQAVYDTTPVQLHTKAVALVWQKFGADIAAFASLLQVPCEIVVAMLAAESGSLARACAIEGDIPSKRAELDKDINTSARYLELMQLYTTMVPTVESRIQSLTVPDPSQVDVNQENIPSPGPNTMTWGELAELAALSPFVSMRVSVGLLQTMITTGRNLARWVAGLEQDLKHSYPLIPGQNLWSLLNVAAPPPMVLASAPQYLFDWLTVPRHSILVGMALMRYQYLGIGVEQTYWDPARTAASYAMGSIVDITSKATSEWGMAQRPLMDYWCKYYNAAVDLFDLAPPAVTPSVRLGV